MEKNTSTSAAPYLPSTICVSVTGRVVMNSMVPLLFSSAKLRMVMAGIRNINIHGAKLKNASSVANPSSRIFVSGNTHAKSPFATKKMVMAIYPISELKNTLSSFLNMAYKTVYFVIY